MKITKKQLRKIIREERARLMEQPDIPDVMGAIGGGRRYVGPTVPDDLIDRIKAVGRGDLQDHLFDIVDAIESGTPDYTLGMLKKNIEDAEHLAEGKRLVEYSEYESNEDLADHMEDMSEVMEAVVEKYVYSGWLATQDQRFLAEQIESLSEEMKRISDKVSRLGR